MGDFNRYFVLHGDTTTAGGEVIGTATHMTVHGKHTAIEGDKVKCPACNSVGVIKCVPPMRTITGHAQAQFAMNGDLCMCKCSPKPRLIASQNFQSMGFSTATIASMPSAMPWFLASGHKPEAIGLLASQRFLVTNAETGEALSNISYLLECDGNTISGITDAQGMTQYIYSENTDSPVAVHLGTAE